LEFVLGRFTIVGMTFIPGRIAQVARIAQEQPNQEHRNDHGSRKHPSTGGQQVDHESQ
jgi:hypothetical protein